MQEEKAREVSSALRDLWRRRARVLATNVATGSREHREIAHAAALIGEDYHDRFLIELVQNANDQAILGNETASTVLVVRSEHFVAVSNSGQVVTARNLERISSLADSDKTGVLVGNKGVGFKAVYQVTDSPEVYSAPEGNTGTSLFSRLGVGFALERRPFDLPALREAVEADVRSFFTENDGLAASLRDRGYEDSAEAIRPEFETAAGFKFPLPRTADDLQRRVEALQIPREHHARIRTLVVLPLRDELARDATLKAIDHLVGAENGHHAQGELAVLFLGGVGELVVLDHVRGKRWSFTCRTDHAENGLIHATVTAVVEGEAPKQTDYWLMRADVFECDGDTAIERRSAVDRALKDFSLEAWKSDDPLPVTVALPRPASGEVAAIGPPGRFCLGLPTEQSTGLLAHVDARFFAKINRDGVNFDHREGYNELLLDVATELFGQLLDHLRVSDQLADRRAVTLALHRPPEAPGALADRVYREGGIADGEVVLAWVSRLGQAGPPPVRPSWST